MTLLFIDSFEYSNTKKICGLANQTDRWPDNLPHFICQMGENSIELKGDFSKYNCKFIFEIKNGSVKFDVEQNEKTKKKNDK